MSKIDHDELRQQVTEKLKDLATPIDFEDLIKKGIIKKRGAWYEILDKNKLPKHVGAQIIEFKHSSTPNEPTLCKFSKGTKRAEKLLKKISG